MEDSRPSSQTFATQKATRESRSPLEAQRSVRFQDESEEIEVAWTSVRCARRGPPLINPVQTGPCLQRPRRLRWSTPFYKWANRRGRLRHDTELPASSPTYGMRILGDIQDHPKMLQVWSGQSLVWSPPGWPGENTAATLPLQQFLSRQGLD